MHSSCNKLPVMYWLFLPQLSTGFGLFPEMTPADILRCTIRSPTRQHRMGLIPFIAKPAQIVVAVVARANCRTLFFRSVAPIPPIVNSNITAIGLLQALSHKL